MQSKEIKQINTYRQHSFTVAVLVSAILKTKLPYLSPEPPVILLPLASTHKQNWGGRVSVFLGKINLFNCTWPVQDTEIENHLSLCLENALIIRVSWRQVKPHRRPTFCVHVTNCRLGLKCNLISWIFVFLYFWCRTTVQEKMDSLFSTTQ